MLIANELKKRVEQQPNKLISVFNDRKTTYREFYKRAEKLAGYFQERGYGKDDVVALLLPNTDYFLVCYYACQIGGFPVLPINTKLASSEISYILDHSEAKALIYDKQFEDTVNKLVPNISSLQDTVTVGDTHTPNRLEDIVAGPDRKVRQNQTEDDDTAVIFYTSGTTGRPKGVMLTNKNILSIAQIWSESMELTNEDRMQIVAPLFHCAASHVFMVPIIYSGGMLVIEEGFSPERAIKTMESENVTIFFGVPAMYSILLTSPRLQQVSVPHLRLLTYGAAPMPFELVKRVKEVFSDVKVQNLYGQTENSPGATTLKDHHALEKVGSVGEPLPQSEVRVVDECGKDVAVGEVGEIIVKGPHVMKGYLKNEEATRETLKDGWLYSGDLGRLDEEGLLYIVDRKKDMIIRGGENIYPVEIEEVLYQIPEILEAAIIGVPDEVLGEVPKAVVAMKEGKAVSEEQIIDYCLERLAKYKVPNEVEFVSSLPRNASGKVLKRQLRGDK
ncbi:class I adenylate-forming enzyme family protein [Desertibacillus haloalkaliphilus]|uniref:class I adenylate-forming enzyme family protein n=1 Tax=Desertibacillus haloalkaliphilus TaxID=1328930 RepID=UPI001C27454D|nr:long-chain-fatty-acid--CoA ligase [Desertibacillus haloalkaliphilus]MBU8907914.1 long-chain-fatty-acid--CoA ligase [Desertibacillus haloalkaliphilus]